MIVDIKYTGLGQMDLRVGADRDKGQVNLVATKKVEPGSSGTAVVRWTRTFRVQAACCMCSVLTGYRLKAKLYDMKLDGYMLERTIPEWATAAIQHYDYEFRMSEITPGGRKLLFVLDADEAAALSMALQTAVQKAMEAIP